MTAALATVAVLTLALALVPALSYAYRAPELQIALDSADAVIAVVVAYLVYGRYRQRTRLRDLLLCVGLSVLALANLPLAAVPQGLGAAPEHLQEWGSLLLRVLGALLFAASALTPGNRRIDVRRARRGALAGAVGLAWVTTLLVIFAKDLPEPVPDVAALDASSPWLAGHPAVLVLQAVGLLLYAVAAWALTRAALREGDEFLSWLAGAAVLAAGARLNFVVFPSLYTDFLYTGDVLRLGFYLLLLVGAAREVRTYWSARVVAAVARGRTDVARELGELLLPQLRQASDQLAAVPEAQQSVRQLVASCEQALAAVRRDVEDVLAAEPFEAALRAALVPLATSRGLSVDVQCDGDVPPARRDPLLSLGTDIASLLAAAGAGSVRISVLDNPFRMVVGAEGAQPQLGGDDRADDLRRLQASVAEAGAVLSLVAVDGDLTTITLDWP